MLKYLYSPRVLRDEAAVDGNGSATRIEPVAPVVTATKEPVVLKGGNDAPLPDDIKDQTFSLDTFEVEQLPPQTDKKVEVKEDANKKPEVKAEVKPKVEAKKVGAIKPPEKQVVKPIAPITPPGKTGAERDYTGFSNEEATVLKQMSNPAFEFASKLIKENKQLAGLKNATYLQHERAYTLDPKFQEKQTELSYVRRESQYWQQQLVLLRSGKDAKEMTGWDQNGQMVFGNTIKPSVENEELLRTAMNNCVAAAGNIESDLRTFPTNYKNQIANDLKAVEETNKQMFSWETDAKLLDYEMEVEGIGKRSIKQIKEDFKGMLPPWMQSHPLVNVCGNLLASLRIGQAYLAEAQQKNDVAQTIDDEKEHKEPTSKAKQTPAGKDKEVHGVSEFSMETFNM